MKASLEQVDTNGDIFLKEANSAAPGKKITWIRSEEKAPWVATKDSEERLSELGFKVKDIGFSETGKIDSFSVAYNQQTYNFKEEYPERHQN